MDSLDWKGSRQTKRDSRSQTRGWGVTSLEHEIVSHTVTTTRRRQLQPTQTRPAAVATASLAVVVVSRLSPPFHFSLFLSSIL